jgi:acetylglutamate kinase
VTVSSPGGDLPGPGGDDLVQLLSEALPYVSRLAGKTLVVKIGGSTLGSQDTTLADCIVLKNLQIDVVVVHGGGAAITDWLRRIDKPASFVDGLRVTDQETMEVVTMTLAGKVNKELVAEVHALGGRAVGVSGVDGAMLRGQAKDPRLGAVGEVTDVDVTLLRQVSAAGYIPVVAPIALGQRGQHLNLNADTAAAEVAVGLAATKLLFLTDVPGIKDQDGSLLSELSAPQARDLIARGVISGGMIPKAAACIRALDVVEEAHIVDGRQPHALIRELFTNLGVGTMIRGGAHG